MHIVYELIEMLLGAIVVCGWGYYLSSCACVRRRLRQQKLADSSLPPVSVLKPLSGSDPDLLENLTSFCQQDYPCFEILCGVRDPDDPAASVVRQLQMKFPGKIRLIWAPALGANQKSATLNELSRRARFAVLAISDSDIQVERDYLRRVVAELKRPGVGLVTCLYASDVSGDCTAGILDALHQNLTFLPSAALGSYLPNPRMAFGATLALQSDDLYRAGGYRAFADHLADDYMLAALIRKLGLQVQVANFLVHHDGAAHNLGELWQRELRWGRTIRTVEATRYLGEILTFTLVWAIVLVAVAGGAIWSWLFLLATIMIRIATAWVVCGKVQTPVLRRYLFLLPISDVLDAIVWAASWMGSCVTWRGKAYRIVSGGKLVPTATSGAMLRKGVRALDAFLRKRERIFEYCDDPHCLFRINLRRAHRLILLHDGTSIAPGERYAELHFWHEHWPEMARAGADLAWAKTTQRQLRDSLAMLGQYFQSHPEFRDVRAIYGKTSFVTRSGSQLARLVERLGFEFHGRAHSGGVLSWLHNRGDDLLIWALSWTFNPKDRNRQVLTRPRHELWMSRQALEDQYAPSEAPACDAPAPLSIKPSLARLNVGG